MAKHIVIERPNGTVTMVRSELETASEDPLTDNEQIINELFAKIKNLNMYIRQQNELMFKSYKEGFDSATESLIAANKVVQEKKMQQTPLINDKNKRN